MNLSDKYLAIVRKFLPSPFAIAVVLTFLTALISLIFKHLKGTGSECLVWGVLDDWYSGLWKTRLLAFTVQMMLILLLGHVLALSEPVEWFIDKSLRFVRSSSAAVALVCFLSLLVALYNWGLGLIFGAILARKVGEYAGREGIPINYPLVGAAAYSGLMVWHGGISGSAPLTVATPDHSLQAEMGLIGISETIFSPMNLAVNALLLILLPLVFVGLARWSGQDETPSLQKRNRHSEASMEPTGAERLDHWHWAGRILGAIILVYCIQMIVGRGGSPDLNFINFSLLGLCLIVHGSFHKLTTCVQEAMGDLSGILLQFPLYFGIMSMMQGSGLVEALSGWFAEVSSPESLPIFSFLSAAIVNIFVPSGGGQWQVQGPVLVAAAQQSGVPMSKMVMSLAYGDQLTNMLQPFWALPLLGITSLKAKDILPYTLVIMLIGALVYCSFLLIF